MPNNDTEYAKIATIAVGMIEGRYGSNVFITEMPAHLANTMLFHNPMYKVATHIHATPSIDFKTYTPIKSPATFIIVLLTPKINIAFVLFIA